MTGHGGGRLMALSGRDGGGHCSALQLNQSSEGGEMQCSGTGTMSPEDQFWGRLCTVNTVHCTLCTLDCTVNAVHSDCQLCTVFAFDAAQGK